MTDWGKYIVIEAGSLELMFIFPATENHADIARALAGTDAPNVVSAGQIRMWPRPCDDDDPTQYPKFVISCFGESTTLGLRARPEEDKRLALRVLGVEEGDLYVNRESRG